eukprot:1252955-Rhodomonas_salina.1
MDGRVEVAFLREGASELEHSVALHYFRDVVFGGLVLRSGHDVVNEEDAGGVGWAGQRILVPFAYEYDGELYVGAGLTWMPVPVARGAGCAVFRALARQIVSLGAHDGGVSDEWMRSQVDYAMTRLTKDDLLTVAAWVSGVS